MSWREDVRRRLVIDSGSYSVRVGTAASPIPSLNYLNCIAIDRSTGSKLYGAQLDNIFDETKLIYEKNNVRGVTVKFETYVTMIDELMARMEMPKKTTGFFCEGYSMTLPLLPYHPKKIMERYMEIYLEYLRFDGIYV
jgi:actin-related protein